jgi:2-methylcitrate dehydratase PrpD
MLGPPSGSQEEPMISLCKMVQNAKYDDFPKDVIKHAKHSILDTVGVIIGGSSFEGVPQIVSYVKEKGGKPDTYLPFYGGKVPAPEAGLALGTMARAMDLGQVHEEAAHNSEYTLPALLAITGLKDRVSGKDFITAFIVGQEVLIRIGTAARVMSKAVPLGRGGGHYIFGVVAAVAKLLRLDLDELINAQGIARGKTQPHDLAMTVPPTLMLRVHHGFICRDAIDCCLFAKLGITGPRREVLTGPRGYLEMAKWEIDPSGLTDRLGEKWEMQNVMMKCYSSCKGTHTAIAGIIDQIERYKFIPEHIATIEVDESSTNWALTCVPHEEKWNPETVSECQFSLPYTVATAAYEKKLFLDCFTPEAMARKEVHELMARISARLDANLPPWAARLTTTLKDGRRFSEEYHYVKGHPKNPLEEQELINKFKTCVGYSAYKLEQHVIESLINVMLELENADDVTNALILPLTPR